MKALSLMRPITCLLVVATLCCGTWAIGRERDEEDRVARIITIIDRMPSWPLLGLDRPAKEIELEFRKGRLINEFAFEISRFPSGDIRRAMLRYEESIIAKQRSSDRREALFFLNKYLFDIPEFVRRDSPAFAVIRTGWWLGMPVIRDENAIKPSGRAFKPSDKVSARWPWSADKQGKWRFSVERRVIQYFGTPYDPVAHFDRLQAAFGRRAHAKAASGKQPTRRRTRSEERTEAPRNKQDK